MPLWDLFLNNTARQVRKQTNYFPVYERYFHSYVGKPLVFLEIGVGRGGSLQMWKKYFGPHATIIGIDIQPRCTKYEEDQIYVRIGSQADEKFLGSILEEFGPPDIVLDDGSHMMSHIIASFDYLYPRVDRNGIYMVEDLHTAYWEEYEGGLRKKETFIEKCKDLIDDINAEHTRGALDVSDFSRSTLSINFSDSAIVFEKGIARKSNVKVGHKLQFRP